MVRLDIPNIGIAVYNEGKNLEIMLRSLKESIIQIRPIHKPDLYICFNGCNDNSIHNFSRRLENLKQQFRVHILSSKKGKLRAHQIIIKAIKNLKPILFIDADILITAEAIKILFKAIYEDKKLIVCSAYPYVFKPKNSKVFQRILFPILNFKRIFPEIEISKVNVERFHPGAKSEFEKKSRVYFHGRCFIIRNKEIYQFPKDLSKIVGDDTFLSFSILEHYPPGSIKVFYNAKVYSKPQLSLSSYLNTWLRIRKDLDNIYEEYPKFISVKKYVEMKPNWEFVLYNLKGIRKIQAILFFLLRYLDRIYYLLKSREVNLETIWSYSSKEN